MNSNRLEFLPIYKRGDRKDIYKPLKYPSIPSSLNDIYIITTIEDRLDTLAYRYYKDTELWWIISCANPGVVRRDSFFIKTGLQIRIPLEIENIKRKFEELNF